MAWVTVGPAGVSRAADAARAFTAAAGLDAPAAARLAVVVEEWVANVVEYGAPPAGARIVLRLRLAGGLLQVSISDPGRPFDPRGVAFDGPNLERGGGAGLALIAGLCRVVGYGRRAGRNRLVLELDAAAPGAG